MAENSVIIDHRGRPLRRQALTREVAPPTLTGVRQVWHPGVAGDLTPDRLAAILRAAAEGDGHQYLTLAEEMEEREPHYAAVLGTRKRAVSGLEVMVEAASDDPSDIQLADEVRALVRRPAFEDLLEDLLDALGKGYSACEIDWDRSERQWWPRGYTWRDPRFFRFDRVGGRELRLIDLDNAIDGVALPAYKFITHVPKLKSGIPLRGGLARLVAVSYMAKSYTVTDWLSFAEVFGMPLRIGRYDDRATDDDVAILRQAVANLGTDAAAILPDGMKVEFQEIANTQGGAELFLKLAEWLDKQTSKAVLGQTMTTDDGSSYAQAGVHNDVRGDIQRADARQLATTLNRDLVKPFIDLNHGRQRHYPAISLHVPEAEDLEKLARVLKELVPMGLRVEESQIRDKLGFADPDPAARLLRAPEAAMTPALNRAANRQAPAPVRVSEEPAFDDAEAAGEDDWQAQLAPIVDPVERLAQQVADEGGDADAFLARLPDLLEEMDERELVRHLAAATLKARGLGNAQDEAEGDDDA
ncbi:DUF935 domain-containing protein [Halomonas sp.]|uniref:DUF935 domain-containing protein n=1 Tax=Halomonas sp. TaxID=1486246 RepID=UPI0025808950|nr:DUF935 domain-containing protein [Halomonas sp.]MCJ8285114.1 DUF935 domain-containing protein [Halomonas sp.]NQY70164.1 DUF935 domain-containing protein [Halomonas sp.]